MNIQDILMLIIALGWFFWIGFLIGSHIRKATNKAEKHFQQTWILPDGQSWTSRWKGEAKPVWVFNGEIVHPIGEPVEVTDLSIKLKPTNKQ